MYSTGNSSKSYGRCIHTTIIIVTMFLRERVCGSMHCAHHRGRIPTLYILRLSVVQFYHPPVQENSMSCDTEYMHTCKWIHIESNRLCSISNTLVFLPCSIQEPCRKRKYNDSCQNVNTVSPRVFWRSFRLLSFSQKLVESKWILFHRFLKLDRPLSRLISVCTGESTIRLEPNSEHKLVSN